MSHATFNVFIIYSLHTKQISELLPNERIGIKPYEVASFFKFEATEHYVINQPVVVQDKQHFYLHCLLRSIYNNQLLSTLEPEQCCHREDTFLSPSKLLNTFKQYPILVTNTYKLLDACSIEMDFNLDKNLSKFGGSNQDDFVLLEKLARAGLYRRYGRKNKVAITRLEKEFKVIFNEPLNFNFELTSLIDDPMDDLYDQMELLGFTITNPFKLVDADPTQFIPAIDIGKYKGKVITMLAYFIARKQVLTKYDDTMFFGTFVDSELNWIDTVHFPEAAKRHPLHTSDFYKILGKVAEDFGVFSLEVSWMEKCGYKNRR